jgi:serine O-acetyltransferase
MDRSAWNRELPEVVQRLVQSVVELPQLQHLNRVYLPNRDVIIECIHGLRQLLFPGYFGKQQLTSANITYRIGELVIELSDLLIEQVSRCLRYREQLKESGGGDHECLECDRQAAEIVKAFFERIPAVREILVTDVQAAFDGDPAAQSTDETILSYPGLFAISVQRMAHEFYRMEVPLLPRIMTEYAHGLTGIDIHPGAKLGKSFFIDHGTGVVIGETTQIGESVKIYQGVTLGAVAPEYGQQLRGQ